MNDIEPNHAVFAISIGAHRHVNSAHMLVYILPGICAPRVFRTFGIEILVCIVDWVAGHVCQLNREAVRTDGQGGLNSDYAQLERIIGSDDCVSDRDRLLFASASRVCHYLGLIVFRAIIVCKRPATGQ